MGGAVAALYLMKIKEILKNPSSKHAKNMKCGPQKGRNFFNFKKTIYSGRGK